MMFYKIKKEGKRFFKALLTALIAMQMCLMPCYPYPSMAQTAGGEHSNAPVPPSLAGENEDPIRQVVKVLEEQMKNNPSEMAKAAELMSFIEAVEKGTEEEYIRNNPQIVKERDYYLLSNQRAESVEYHFNPNTKQFIAQGTRPVTMNDYTNQALETAVKEVRVHYRSGELVFEGIVANQVIVRQYIPNMDIIAYRHDKELLVILDKNKGLLLMDMFLVKSYIGMSPLPVVPVKEVNPVLERMKKTAPLSEWTKDSLSLEFIHRAGPPFKVDTMPKHLEETERKLNGHSLFTAGDFVITYTDEAGKKHLLKFITRAELTGWLNISYEIIDIMTKIIAPHLMKKPDFERFSQELQDAKQKDPVSELDHILSALFNKKALHKMTQIAEGLRIRTEQLQDQDKQEKDVMLFNEWSDYFNTISLRLKKIHNRIGQDLERRKNLRSEQNDAVMKRRDERLAKKLATGLSVYDRKERKEHGRPLMEKLIEQYRNPQRHITTGDMLNTREINMLYNTEKRESILSDTPERKSARAKALRIMADIIGKKTVDWSKKHLFTTAVGVSGVAGAGSAAFLYPEVFVTLTDFIFRIFHNFSHYDGGTSFRFSSAPHLLVMLGLLPGFVLLTSYISIPFAQLVKNYILPMNFHIPGMNKVFHPKGVMEDFLKKWENTTTLQRIVGFGMRLVAYGIYPFWNYMAQAVGQPHFFPAWQKGLKARQIIHPDSDIGKLADIKKPTRLGSQGPIPQFRKNGKGFQTQVKLQNAAMAKEVQIKSIAWLMATLAVAEKTGMTHQEILLYAMSSANIKDLEKVQNEMTLRMEALWVQNNLIKEIRKLNNINIQKTLRELDPKMVMDYYKEAEKLTQSARAHSYFRKKVRNTLNGGWNWLSFLKHNIINKQTVAGFNQKQHELLKTVPGGFITDRTTKEVAIDHAWISLVPFVFTERSEIFNKNLNQTLMNANNTFWSGGPHLSEILLNLHVHFFLAGSGRTMTFLKKQAVIEDLRRAQDSVYEPMENRANPIKNPDGELTYIQQQLAYVASGGKPGNMGGIMARTFVQGRLRLVQLSFASFIFYRMIATEQSLHDMFMGFLLFYLAAHWIFNWPWDYLAGGDNMRRTKLAENQQKMESITLKLSKLTRGVYESDQEARSVYETVLKDIAELYGFKGSEEKQLLRDLPVGRHYSKFFLRKTLSNSGLKIVDPKLFSYLKSADHRASSLSWPVSENTNEIEKIKSVAGRLTALLQQLAENQNHNENLKNRFSKVAEGKYSPSKMLAEYKKALKEIFTIYAFEQSENKRLRLSRIFLRKQILNSLRQVNPELWSYLNNFDKNPKVEWHFPEDIRQIKQSAGELAKLYSRFYENREETKELETRFSKVAKGDYGDNKDLISEYQQALEKLISLYALEDSERKVSRTALARNTLFSFSDKQNRKQFLNSGIKEVNPELWSYLNNFDRNSLFQWDEEKIKTEEIKKTAGKLLTFFLSAPPLTNQKNQLSDVYFTIIMAGILTNILYVMLSVWTFSGDHLTWRNIGMWFVINTLGYIFLYLAWKKGIKQHRADIKAWKVYLQKKQVEWNNWKRAFIDLKAPEQRWTDYFHDRFLDLNKSVSNVCRRAFRQ